MNYIKHLTGFFDKVTKDRLLNPTHISLYIALFQFWNCNRFKNPISISRDEVMRISKIASKATYHKCLKELHMQGYIKYEPSYNPFKGSHVFLFNFSEDLKPLSKNNPASSKTEPLAEQVLNKSQVGTDTGAERVNGQALVPSINNTNKSNIINIENALNRQAPEEKIEKEISDFKIVDAPKEKKSSAKKKESPIPALADVLAYFIEKDFPELEANKYFNYFQSTGWLVGGKTPMADWQAAARNWMLNAPKYVTNERTDRAAQLDTSGTKDYSEPL